MATSHSLLSLDVRKSVMFISKLHPIVFTVCVWNEGII